MDDLISRQAAIEAYGDWYVEEGTAEGFIGTVKQLLEGLPSAERRGRWIETGMLYRYTRGINSLFYGKRCSVCNKISDYKPNYCPNCGSRMDLESEDE